jgi:hypothetical protein
MNSNQGTQGSPLPALKAWLVVASVVSLSACGGGADEAVSQDIAAQHQKQAAALSRAHAINADAVSKIKAERSGRSAPSN